MKTVIRWTVSVYTLCAFTALCLYNVGERDIVCLPLGNITITMTFFILAKLNSIEVNSFNVIAISNLWIQVHWTLGSLWECQEIQFHWTNHFSKNRLINNHRDEQLRWLYFLKSEGATCIKTNMRMSKRCHCFHLFYSFISEK